jgi:hypothetical protein
MTVEGILNTSSLVHPRNSNGILPSSRPYSTQLHMRTQTTTSWSKLSLVSRTYQQFPNSGFFTLVRVEDRLRRCNGMTLSQRNRGRTSRRRNKRGRCGLEQWLSTAMLISHRQIWELIQGEMEYVADLEVIDQLFVDGLRIAEKGIVIERTRLETFLDEAFHNYRSLLEVHSRLLENLQNRQLEQHPHFGMISDLLLDATLNWQDAYMEYVTHYPIAKAKVQEEEVRNPKFAAFLKVCSGSDEVRYLA